MIREITIGQYYKADSPIHSLDPRVKIIGTLVYIISLCMLWQFTGFAFAVLFFGLIVKLSKVPLNFIIRGLRPVLLILVFTAMLNLFWTPGEVLWEMGFVHITAQGIQRSIFLALRLILLIVGSSLMTLTTTPNQLTDAMENLLHPLENFHVPVHEIAMMMSIALRFIPILLEETNRIMKAQMARGADFESGNIIRRLYHMVSVLVPLFASAIRRATDLANAMDARCYHGGAGRTKMKPLQYQTKDIRAYVYIVVYFILAIFVMKFMP